MDYTEYFESREGLGVLSTADEKGKVNAALYARPHSLKPGTVSFIMSDHLTRANLEKNPSAVYLFKETGAGYEGIRLYLKKTEESADPKLINSLSRRRSPQAKEDPDYLRGMLLITFEVVQERPLTGASA